MKSGNHTKSLLLTKATRELFHTVALGTNGWWGGLHVQFNRQYDISKTVLESDDYQFIQKHIDTLETKLDEIWSSIYSGCLSRNDELIESKCVAALGWLESQLDWIALLTSCCTRTLDASIEKGKITPRSLGPICLKMGTLVRELGFSAVLGYYILSLLGLPEDSIYRKEIYDSARSLPLIIKVPNGKDVKIRSLSEDGDRFEDVFVEVEGYVTNSRKSRTADNKLLSHFTLVGPSGRYEIPVIAIYENLVHAGIADGCYVKVNGKWKKKTSISDKPYLQMEKLPISDLSKQSWKFFMIKSLDRWFERYPNSYHISWSLAPEEVSEDRKTSRGGAGEAIYKSKFGIRR